MKLLVTLQLEEGDTHPATVRIAGSAGITLNSIDAGHISVDAAMVRIDVPTVTTTTDDTQAE